MDVQLQLSDAQNLTPREFTARLVGMAVERINQGISRQLTARRSIETPPRDSRHLTDTRTRVSTLLEYSLGYEMNGVLADESPGYSVSADSGIFFRTCLFEALRGRIS